MSYSLYQAFIYGWVVLAIIIFFMLLKITAPYGRHSSEKWGPLINNKSGWIIMESAVLITLSIFIIPNTSSLSAPAFLMLIFFCFHYLNRTFIFPLRLHTQGKKMPLLIVCSGVMFNIVNGSSLGYYFVHFAHYDLKWLSDLRFITGTILFFTGMFINWKADDILIHLRKPNETHYVIPTKWLFEYISCPNLFGELIEWLGFALLCWNLPALAFFLWTSANLVPRALSHHRWYKKQFSNYPSKRFAVVPYLI
ncbi:MAG TPA: 3-oxo-5-alpha-steroid 4-dehydrogenase [Puia sp.]|nr:3-oxo-5-alpha-steroid 4-dehydrogenase [Puia sp.]